jgi:hypothetical protein
MIILLIVFLIFLFPSIMAETKNPFGVLGLICIFVLVIGVFLTN